MKKCRYCSKLFEPRRKHAKFCTDTHRVAYHREKREVIKTPEYHLFLKWRRLIGPITKEEVERFARWRSRSLKRSPLNQARVETDGSAQGSKSRKHNESKDGEKRLAASGNDGRRLRTKRSHVRVVPGASATDRKQRGSKNKKRE